MMKFPLSLKRSPTCLILAALISACGNTLEERAGSGAAIGAGAGVAVGAVASPAVLGSAVVGAVVGGSAGVAVHESKTNGASQPTGVVLRQLLQEQARLWNVSDPILTQGVEVCRERTRPSFGFVAWTRWDIDRRYRIASMGQYGLDDRLRVVHVLSGSPADLAGLRAGDVIEKLGPHDMPTGQAAGAALGLIVQREARVGVPQTFQVRRGATRHRFEMVPRPQCDIDLIVTESDRANAFVQGQSIYLTDGLMRFLSDDQELAAVTAHFIGHALFGHHAVKPDETVAGKLTTEFEGLMTASLDQEAWTEMKKTGTLPGAHPYSGLQEIQADRAALELLARAGYEMDALVEVWQRLAESQSAAMLLDDFHPPSEERRSAIQDLLDQVRGQDGAGEAQPGS